MAYTTIRIATQVNRSYLITCADDEWRVSSQGTADTSTLSAREWSEWGSGVRRGAGKCGTWQVRYDVILQHIYVT